MTPVVSILTVVRNDLGGLRRTHASIGTLTPEVEWIVVDGASTDGTPAWLATIDPPVRWTSEPDAGIYDAMNKAALRAYGTWALFLNAGDALPDDLDILTSARDLPDDCGIWYGAARLEMPNGRTWIRRPLPWPSCIQDRLPAIHQAVWYRREVLLRFPYRTDLRICGDYDQLARMAQAGISGASTKRELVHFRVGDASFKHPWRLMRESLGVRRRVLRQGAWRLALSFAKLLVSTCSLQVLTRLARWRSRR